jgi:hypothetical protein
LRREMQVEPSNEFDIELTEDEREEIEKRYREVFDE